MQGDLAVTGNADADKLLNTDPFALLLGMLLDQHMQEKKTWNSGAIEPLNWGFATPRTVALLP